MTVTMYLETAFSLYSPGHILMMALTAVLLGGSVPVFLLMRKKDRTTLVLSLAAAATTGLTGAALIYSVATGLYNLEWYLPFHICNAFMLVYPLALIFKKRLRALLSDYIVFAGIGGCLLEIVFPINTLVYLSAANPVTILVYAYHLVIGLVAFCFIFSGQYKQFRCYSLVGILSALIIGATVMNQLCDTNFLFLNPGYRIFPLTAIYDLLGFYAVYLIAAALLATAVGLHIFIDKTLTRSIKR